MLAAIPVVEGQQVTKGTLLAELRNDVQRHQVALASAELAIAEAEFERLRNGERPESRQAAAAQEQARRVQYQQAKADWERSRKLSERGNISPEEHDRAYFAMMRAQADFEAATAERQLVEAPARADELAAAEGRVAVAEAKLLLARAELEKTRLVAPCDGRILRVLAEPGELAGPIAREPVLLFADLAKCRVRAFVEELDVTQVCVGQAAEVTTDSLAGASFPGRVVLVAPRMGKHAPQTDEPGEYKDLYFREIIIELDGPGDELPLNLRVQARIQVGVPEEDAVDGSTHTAWTGPAPKSIAIR